MTFHEALDIELEAQRVLLTGKNIKYGNSVFDPIRIFAKNASVIDLINNRIDDKLSRIARGGEFDDGENPEEDLIGYLILKRMWVRMERMSKDKKAGDLK